MIQRRRISRPAFAPTIGLTQAMTDDQLFGQVFQSPSFWTWKVVAKLIDGIALTKPREIELFEQCTGRTYSRAARRAFRRIIILAGRRAGKDRFESGVAVWRAALCCNWSNYASAGEGSVAILLGADRKQASLLRRYAEGLLRAPLLAPEVVRQTNEVIEFRNGASLEISTNDARLVRGRSAIAVLGSECSHWKTDEHSSSSDEEVVGAALPSMAMCPDQGILVMGSSVYRKRGFMYRKYRECFGDDDSDDLVWFATSQTMNPKLPASFVDRALVDDPAKARAEFLNIWREDISELYPPEIVESSSDAGIYERPWHPGHQYFAWADAAGGTGRDSFTLAICHKGDDNLIHLDLIRERKPRFIPAQVVAEYAAILKSYHVNQVHGDAFGGGFHSSEWTTHGIAFVGAENSTSENYLASLPLLLAGRVRLLDNLTLRNQLTSLERTVGSGDHEKVEHPRHVNAHDDVATSVCGALVLASLTSGGRDWVNSSAYARAYLDAPSEDDPHEASRREAEAKRQRHHQELLERFGQPSRLITPETL